jgi:hypothetical protein
VANTQLNHCTKWVESNQLTLAGPKTLSRTFTFTHLIYGRPAVGNDEDCFYSYEKWCSTLDWGSRRSNFIFYIWDYQWFAFTSFAFLCRKKICSRKKAVSPRSHPAS